MPPFFTEQPSTQFLDSVGDGTGDIQATGDYRTTPGVFKIVPPPGKEYAIARLLVVVRDNAPTAERPGISAEKYGNITGGLTNGIRIEFQVNGVLEQDLLGGHPIRTNIDWCRYAGVDSELKAWGDGDEFVAVRWTFTNAGPNGKGEPVSLMLDGGQDHSLAVICEDDLTGLLGHTFSVQGTSE